MSAQLFVLLSFTHDPRLNSVLLFLLTQHSPQYETTSHAEHGTNHAHTIHKSDLTTNLEAKIKNPLAGIARHELLANVESFVEEKGLTEHVGYFKKGALVAQDPDQFETIGGEFKLDEAEVLCLQREVTHKWRVPKTLYLTIATCSIGAAVQGWDQEGSNGANLSFPAALGIDESTHYGTYMVGLINAAPYIASAYVGSFRGMLLCAMLTPVQSHRLLAVGPSELLSRTARCHLSLWQLLLVACHWIRLRPDLATTLGLPSALGDWHGCQGQQRSDLCCREFPCGHKGCSRYVLAYVSRPPFLMV